MASNDIGRWSVKAGVDAGQFGAGVNAMTAATNRASKGISAGFTGMEQAVDGALGGVGASMGAFGMRVGFQSVTIASAINAVKQLWTGLSETLESDLELGFLADQLDVSIEFLSSLQTVASENSVTAGQFSSAMQRFNQTMGQANQGSEEAIRTFSQLGLEWTELRSTRPEQQFLVVAQALADTENRSVRARLAMELFGRGGAGAMLRFVEDINRSLGDVQARGAFLTAEDLAHFRELDDSIDAITTQWSQAWREFLGTTAPAITAFFDRINAILQGPRWALLLRLAVPQAGAVQDIGNELPESWTNPLTDTFKAAEEALRMMVREGRLMTDAEVQQFRRNLEGNRQFGALPAMPEVARSTEEANRHLERFNAEMSRLRQQNRVAGLLSDISEADRIFEQTRTPVEQFENRIERLIYLFNEGNLSADTFSRGVNQALGALSGTAERRLPGLVTFGSAAATTQVNQTQAQIRDRVDTLIVVSRETRDALRDILRANPEVQGILQGGV